MKTLSLLLVCAAACVSVPAVAAVPAVAPAAAVAQDQTVVAQFSDSVSLADDLTNKQTVFLKEVRFSDGIVCVVAKAGNMQTPPVLSCLSKDQQDPQERH